MSAFHKEAVSSVVDTAANSILIPFVLQMAVI